MPELLIGCGGWQYFSLPGFDPLRLYSAAFRFVEVNSTFYRIPDLGVVRSWRRRVPPWFEFSVKANRMLTHKEKLHPSEKAAQLLSRFIEICRILRCRVLVLELPRSLNLSEDLLRSLEDLLSMIDLGEVRVAVEARSGWSIGENLIEGFRDLGVIPVVDYSREDPPYEDDEIAYSRLFGRGEHNIYQFTDEDLKNIKKRAEARKSKKVYLSFHGINMYLDAARMEKFVKTGELPRVTRSYGIDSLAEVLADAVHDFPMTKQELVRRHGWKLIDVDEKTRVPASVILKQLRKDSYTSLDEVLSELRRRFEKA